MNSRYPVVTSRRLDDDRIVALACNRTTGQHLMRFRKGALATDVRLSREAMLAVVEMYFQLHEQEILLVADQELRTASVVAARNATGRGRP